MPAFDTPEPISLSLDLGVADVRITAEKRTDTVVEVRPTDENDSSDVQAAEQTTVEFTGGVLTVKSPRVRPMEYSRRTRSVDVSIVLPAGSHVRGEAQMADLSCAGPLGECAFKTAAGHLRLEQTGPLRLKTSAGHITVGRVEGDAEVGTLTGRIQIGEIDGSATAKNSNGNTEFGTVAGDVHVRGANGDVRVDHALGLKSDVELSNGSIRIGEVTRGAVKLKTASGDLEIGIGAGAAAKLDLSTGFGRVNNALDKSDADASGKSVDVRAKTSYGDITINRA